MTTYTERERETATLDAIALVRDLPRGMDCDRYRKATERDYESCIDREGSQCYIIGRVLDALRTKLANDAFNVAFKR